MRNISMNPVCFARKPLELQANNLNRKNYTLFCFYVVKFDKHSFRADERKMWRFFRYSQINRWKLKWSDLRNIKEFVETMIYCRIRGFPEINYTEELFPEGEREELVVKVVEQSKQVNGFKSATDFINQSLQMFYFSPPNFFNLIELPSFFSCVRKIAAQYCPPENAVAFDRTVKLGNHSKFTLVLSKLRNYISNCNNVILVVVKVHLVVCKHTRRHWHQPISMTINR